MTAAPLDPPYRWPTRPLTVAEYLDLGETELRTELVEGLLVMSPPPLPMHNQAARRLANAIELVRPAGYDVVLEVAVDLQLAHADKPGFVRVPDLVVVRAEALRRVNYYGGAVRASEVLLAVEVISPGSVRADRVVKRGEYADAGIPHYWIVDLSEPVSVLACHLAGEFGYADGGEFTGRFTTTEPFPFDLEPSRLG